MLVYFSEEIKANNIALGKKLLRAEKDQVKIELLIHALEHAIAMMETSIDRYGDPALLFDIDYYRKVVFKSLEG